MSLEHPVIAIVGAGAVGGYYGARLAQHGHTVHFLLRSDYETVRTNGWVIRSCDGDFVLRPDQIHVHNTPATMPKADLVIITLKATANDQYQPLIAPLIKDDTLLLTLQNGLGNEQRLADLFGAHRVLGGLAFVCINRIAPGQIAHTDHGQIQIGEFQGPPTQRTLTIAKMFNAVGVRTKVLDSLLYGRWEKLLWNIPFNGLGAAMDLPTDALIGNEAGLALVRSIMEEVCAIAAALGVQFPPDIIDQKIDHTRTMGSYRSSMQIDRQAGRPLEVEAILGQPVSVAQSLGIQVPRMEMLYRLVRLVDPAAIGNPGRPINAGVR